MLLLSPNSFSLKKSLQTPQKTQNNKTHTKIHQNFHHNLTKFGSSEGSSLKNKKPLPLLCTRKNISGFGWFRLVFFVWLFFLRIQNINAGWVKKGQKKGRHQKNPPCFSHSFSWRKKKKRKKKKAFPDWLQFQIHTNRDCLHLCTGYTSMSSHSVVGDLNCPTNNNNNR